MYNERQREWQRENRAMLVKCHLCRQCGSQDARTLNGYSYCYECNEKRNAHAAIYREMHKAEINAKKRERYAKLKSENKCPMCGRNTIFNGVICARCAARQEKLRKARYDYKRIDGMCYQCCNAEPLPGRKLCQNCYDKNIEKLKAAWRKRGIIC